MKLPHIVLAAWLIASSGVASASIVLYMAAVPQSQATAASADWPQASRKLFSGTLSNNSVMLEKSWHGIQWLLCHCTSENRQIESKTIYGGKRVGKTGIYVHSPEDVIRISSALEAIPEAKLRANFLPGEMTEANIYPNDWDEEPEEWLDYLLSDYRTLKEFFRQAAKDKSAVVFAYQ